MSNEDWFRKVLREYASNGDLFTNDLMGFMPHGHIQQNVEILLVFGPCHGGVLKVTSSSIRQSRSITVVWTPNYGIRYVDVNYMDSYMLDQMNHRGFSAVHTYVRMEEFANNNMEECTLFSHDDSCCEEQYDPQKQHGEARKQEMAWLKDPMNTAHQIFGQGTGWGGHR